MAGPARGARRGQGRSSGPRAGAGADAHPRASGRPGRAHWRPAPPCGCGPTRPATVPGLWEQPACPGAPAAEGWLGSHGPAPVPVRCTARSVLRAASRGAADSGRSAASQSSEDTCPRSRALRPPPHWGGDSLSPSGGGALTCPAGAGGQQPCGPAPPWLTCPLVRPPATPPGGGLTTRSGPGTP